MNFSYTRFIEIGVAVATGLTAGGMSYITFVEAPCRAKLSAADQVLHFRTTFHRAMGVFKPAGIVLVPTLIVCARLTGKPLYYAAALPFALFAPFTALTIAPIYKQLLTCPSPANPKEEEDVKALVSTWAKRHAVRTFLAISGFMCTVSACVLLEGHE
ncbi:hypothetical protein BWQ96_01388 [Gracilariopsis chorda]|uniref:DUF1772-domain-containing protein n=1 Tax=Gracilariopsis chorda TaxID=448386 RepID=A0A2V3J3Y2_9FLOR|nr:hypothetical protein BWQ96_01388 [Gracilariopsis chorda]|eukprot:PXF48832.1 hypothetical protein BWQ96_01388 [Gracilariopsis chorda]